MKTLKNLLRSGLFIAAFLTFAGIAHATDFIVDTTTTDEGSGDCLTGTSGTCTIHRAINLATSASEGPNRIIFSSSISGQAISGFSSPALISGDTQELTIDGEENNITMSGTNGPILSISNTASNITIQNINFDNGGGDWFGMGGAGSITVSSPDTGTTVTIQNNGFTHSTCPGDGTRFRTAVYATPSTNPYNIEVLNNTFSGYNAFTTEASNATFTVTGNEIDSNCSTLAIYARAGKGTISDNDISINGTISLEGLMSAITYNNALPPPEFPSETGTVEISNKIGRAHV